MNPIITERTIKNNVKAYVQGSEDVYEMGENESVAISKLLLRLQGKHISSWSGSMILAAFSWLSVFAEMWMLLTGYIEGSNMAYVFLIFFLFFAIFSSSYSTRR